VTARPTDRGFALLVVLWTLVLVSLIATQVTATGRGAVQVASNLRASAVLEAAADGAVHEAIFRALDPSAQGWRADGRTRRLPMPDGEVTVQFLDEAGKLNPNVASPELMAALLRQFSLDVTAATRLAAAIADWRFVGVEARPLGAKASAYRAAGRDYGPPNAPFESISELGAVLGMTPDLLERLAPHLTVFHDGDPDPGVASREVLQALRLVFGAQELAPAPRGATSTVTITATASRADGTRFTRRATVRIGEGSEGRAYRIHAWDRGPE
jgi:general secretion pathway protein K